MKFKFKKFDIYKCIKNLSKDKNIAFIFNAEDKILEYSNGKSIEDTDKWVQETLKVDFKMGQNLEELLGEHIVIEFETREKLHNYIKDRENCGFYIVGYSDGEFIRENT